MTSLAGYSLTLTTSIGLVVKGPSYQVFINCLHADQSDRNCLGADSSRWNRAVKSLGQQLHPNDQGRDPQSLVPGIALPHALRILTNLHHAPSPTEDVRSRTSRRDWLSQDQEKACIAPALTT